MANKYTIHAMVLGSTMYGGLTSAGVDEGSEIVADDSGSVIYPGSRVLVRSAPTISCESRSVSQWLTALFPAGRIIPHLEITAANGPLYVYYKRKTNAGDASGSTLIRRVVRRGVIVPRRISVQGSQIASIQIEVLAATDLTNAAMTYESAQSLPSGNANAAALHSVRAIRNGSAGSVFSQIQSMDIDFGVSVEAESPTNSIYSTGFAITGCRPTLQATTTDVRNALNLYYTSPAAAASGGLIVYIANAVVGGVSATGALGLVFRGASSLLVCRTISLGEEPCTAVLECLGGQGSANTDAAISLSTGLALPADAAPTLFRRGPIYENGTEIEYGEGSIDLGVNIEPIQPANNFSPTDFPVLQKVRSLRFTTHDAEFRGGIGAIRAVDTNFKVWLRKMGDYSEGKADAITEHIGLTLTGGVVEPDDWSAGSAEITRPGFMVKPETAGGATDPLTLSLDSAISS